MDELNEALDLGENELEAAEPAQEPEETEVQEEAQEPQEQGENEAEPAEQPPEVRAHFAEIRRRAEQANAMQARMDALARARGFSSFDELETAVQKEQQERERQEYIQKHGVDPDALKPLVQRAVAEDPAVLEARRFAEQQRQQQVETFKQQQVEDLAKQFPDAGIKTYDDICALPNASEILGMWAKGIPLSRAYAAANLDKITAKKAEAAKQAAINSITGKSHMAPTSGNAGEAIEIPADQMELFREIVPDATDDEIRRFYAKTHKGK